MKKMLDIPVDRLEGAFILSGLAFLGLTAVEWFVGKG
jgi:hypothetical protein